MVDSIPHLNRRNPLWSRQSCSINRIVTGRLGAPPQPSTGSMALDRPKDLLFAMLIEAGIYHFGRVFRAFVGAVGSVRRTAMARRHAGTQCYRRHTATANPNLD